ncbi:MAG: hypothetical protein K1W33_05280 [Clostridia bacterium]|nr:hypothetical protein [Clostridia bacterium]
MEKQKKITLKQNVSKAYANDIKENHKLSLQHSKRNNIDSISNNNNYNANIGWCFY